MIDLHLDSILQQRLFGYRPQRAHRAGLKGQPLFWHADLPRMKQAGYRGACLGVHYFPWESEGGWRELHKQLDAIDALGEEPGVRRLFKREGWQAAIADGALALMPGVEGAHMLNTSVSRVSELAERGVAYMTLAHLGSNSAASTGWGWRSSQTRSLTDYGEALVRELERCEVLVDLAHVNHPGVMRACELATKPLLCTHTGARALHDHPRNLRDEAIDAIAATGGVIGVIFCPMFLTGKPWSDSSCVVDHLLYLIDRIGINHVALGSDFDGWVATIPSDMRDCRDVSRIAQGLAARGLSEQEIERVFWRNACEILSGAR